MTIYHKICNDQDSPAIIPKNEVFGSDGTDSGILKYKITTTPHNVAPLGISE